MLRQVLAMVQQMLAFVSLSVLLLRLRVINAAEWAAWPWLALLSALLEVGWGAERGEPWTACWTCSCTFGPWQRFRTWQRAGG